MLGNWTIRWRLRIAVAGLALLVVVVGVFALLGLRETVGGLRELYGNELASTRLLGTAEIHIGRARAVVLRAPMAPSPEARADDLKKGDKYWDDSETAWKTYLALPADEEERRLATQVTATRQELKNSLASLQDSIAKDDVANQYDRATALGKRYTRYVDANDALKKLYDERALQSYNAAEAAYSRLQWLTFGAIAFSILAALGTSYSLNRAISRPLDEVLTHFSEMADGDLRRPAHAATRDEMGKLLQALGVMKSQLSETVINVRRNGESIAASAREIAAGNLDLSSRTEQQAASLEETAASMEEITGTVRRNMEHATQADAMSRVASEQSDAGSIAMAQVSQTMGEIDAGSQKIRDIIGIIDGIAFQTNILALNAAVEAARAGAHGRGFAVVATEVRTLAQRSASAAREIKALIDTSTARISTGTRIVSEANSVIQNIGASVQRMTEIISDISRASAEQTTGIEQIGGAVTEMDQVTQQNAALVEQASAAAQSLAEQAEGLKLTMAGFKTVA